MSLNNLAISLTERFERQGMPSDLNEAIEPHWHCLPGYVQRCWSHAHTSSCQFGSFQVSMVVNSRGPHKEFRK
ncbi:uncharacterized protein BJ212DRAFT_1387894 [Suillus subaureus]|uniref:Uncharacterized protein n=1 Tax=Suillus subaureus TaxID=48587 RepID=A0A9P7J7K8_9AGAM|nr:uncharacterized protein BJ212DRAFT_1387894 [Suillus subaureus]KAG1807088.1 hypothetical protein BJ212DRAFT_1387894 [Suillus subaureus]